MSLPQSNIELSPANEVLHFYTAKKTFIKHFLISPRSSKSTVWILKMHIDILSLSR